MALEYQAKFRAVSADGKKRTITISPFDAAIDTDNAIKEFAEKLQPVITDSITSYEVYRIRSIDTALTAQPGSDGIPDSTKDSTIIKLVNATDDKTITIANSASAYESDTAAFNAYATAVYEFASELTGMLEGDYSVDDVTLRAVFDYEVADPS